MFNINIKAIIFEEEIQELYSKELNVFLDKLKEFNTKTCICKDTDFKNICKNIRIPEFNCVVFGVSDEFIDSSIKADFKTVRLGGDFKQGLLAQVNSLSLIDVKTFLECGRTKAYEVDENAFIEREIDRSDTGHIESIFALGNGYLGLRGTYDETDELLLTESGMYINGIFEKEPFEHLWDCKGFARNEQYTVNLADWRIIEMYIDGEKATTTKLKKHLRRLDMRSGTIERSFEFETSGGKIVSVKSSRMVNMKKVHGAEISYTVTPLNFDGEVVLKSTVIKNTPISNKITTKTVAEECIENGIAFTVETERTKLKTACAIVHRTSSDDYECEAWNAEDKYSTEFKVSLNKNKSFTLEKYAVFYADVDNVEDIQKLALDEVLENAELGFEYFKREQRAFWDKHWENGDIQIDGNAADQQAVRLSLFYLRQQLPVINNASIGATGLTGANYSGKVFWDTEMYLMPYYLHTEPESVKGLLMYRIKLLDKARERANQLGAEGALYSWCSIDGEETSVVFEASTAEYHINADIAYAVWRYGKVTDDYEFIYENCAEMLFETAKFYAHRGTFVEAHDGRFCINSVCGPDEYACGVNNNCYTNFMVQFHFRYALSVLKEMQDKKPQLLKEILLKTGINQEELNLWQEAADKMYYRKNEKYGIYEQDDRFIYNDAVDMEMIPKNFDIRHMFHPLDLWRIQVLKQADVVLLNFVLGDKFTVEEKKANFDYYEPKTNHGSSLSATIHAVMACEIGYRREAYEYFKSTAFMDIGDFKKNTSGGIHIACMGGVWMSVVNGFLGMRLYEGGIQFNINLPKEWNGLKTRIYYKGAVIEIYAKKDGTRFSLVSGCDVKFKAGNREVSLSEQEDYIVI